jgi:hypothetical protein
MKKVYTEINFMLSATLQLKFYVICIEETFTAG